MKKTISILSLVGIIALLTLGSCKKKIEDTNDPPATPATSATILNAKFTTTAPTLDGLIDASWANCDVLSNTATVPTSASLAADFAFFQGEKYEFTMRSQYDVNNLYILLEYKDPTKSLDRMSWYFNGTTKLWKQQSKKPLNATDKFYEDKFAFLWPTATAGADWNANTCYNTCHAVDKTKGFDTENKHYTEVGETIDMWHYKGVRTGPSNQTDDQKMISVVDLNNPTATEKADGGRGSDANTGGGVFDNKQTLNNGAANVSVPLWIIPNNTNYFWINVSDTANGTAKKITGVDENGILTYNGGTIDPATGGYETGTGTKRFPSIMNKGTVLGSRGDIITFGNHTGTGWVFEIKRPLTTTDLANDVQWDIAKDYMFGFAIFENSAVAHGIKANLKLTFAK
ncbi:MAG: ethylbenzene dehydrogenase-related protein [bacterium]|nr:ethylbenzene dehydrogenase-related protein [bacterium]